MSKRVELFIIGTSKAGTTSICALLDQHPKITLSKPKEPHYFGAYHFPRMTEEQYHACFHGPESNIWLDGSTTYSRQTTQRFGGAAARIAAYNPDARIVYVVRHPLERIVSLWVQHRGELKTRMGTEFNKSIRDRPDAFVDGSNYQLQLNEYRNRFPEENIKVLFFEDFKRNADAVLNPIVAHVGLEPIAWDTGRKQWNPSQGKKADADWLKQLRRTRARKAFKYVKRVPALYKGARWLRQQMATPLEKPEWDPATKAWVIEQLQRPTQEFLASLGEDRWDVAGWT